MKKITLIIALFSIFSFAFISIKNEDKDYNKCIEKYKSTWAEPCMDCTYNNDIFKVFYKNICDENLDILIAVQEVNKSWNCFYREEFKPQDTIVAHACKGTGKSLFWIRKAGDRELVFPTCDEINVLYKK